MTLAIPPPIGGHGWRILRSRQCVHTRRAHWGGTVAFPPLTATRITPAPASGDMSPENPSWNVIKTTTFSGRQFLVPKVVAELIGLRVDLPAPGNGIAFLDAGPRVARVAAVAGPWVGATRETMPFAVATPTRKLVFSLPKALERHLGVEVPRPRGEKEVLVWSVGEGAPTEVYVRRAGIALKP